MQTYKSTNSYSHTNRQTNKHLQVVVASPAALCGESSVPQFEIVFTLHVHSPAAGDEGRCRVTLPLGVFSPVSLGEISVRYGSGEPI